MEHPKDCHSCPIHEGCNSYYIKYIPHGAETRHCCEPDKIVLPASPLACASYRMCEIAEENLETACRNAELEAKRLRGE